VTREKSGDHDEEQYHRNREYNEEIRIKAYEGVDGKK